jgi:hypothetical protein
MTAFFENFFKALGFESKSLWDDSSGESLSHLERRFGQVLFGQILGRPSPPLPILFQLFPHIRREFAQVFDFDEDEISEILSGGKKR